MKLNFKKGFTLIELLVVVAIIGVLASVVLASLNTARSKGADAAAKADYAGIRASAEVWYDSNSNKYSTTGVALAGVDCGTTFTANTFHSDSNVSAALAHAKNQNGGTALYCNINATGSAYAIAGPLKSTGKYWCIDSTGVSRGTQGTGSTDYTATSGSATAALTDNADVTCN